MTESDPTTAAIIRSGVVAVLRAPTADGFANGDLSGIGNLFDQTLFPIDINAFGQPSDIDQNGRMIMLMTPVVNALVTAADCTKS